VRHTWYVVSHCRPHDTGSIKGWMQFPSPLVIWRSFVCHNSEEMTVGKLKTIQNLHQMYG
jgi:hypothetical protein